MSHGGGDGGGEMTLVFAFPALELLVGPAEAVESSKAWSDYVGVVGDLEPDELKGRLEQTGADPDFVSGKRGTAGSIAAIRQRFPSDRHVFIGTTEEHQNVAEALGWEFLPLEEAAEKADWSITDRGDGTDNGTDEGYPTELG